MDLYIVRHGQSTAQTGEDTGVDPILSEKGFLQADLLGRALSQVPFDAVYSSHQSRAFLTALGVIGHQPNKLPITVVPELAECGVDPFWQADTNRLQSYYNNIIYTKTALNQTYENDYQRAEAALSVCVYPNAYNDNMSLVRVTDEGEVYSCPKKILIASHGMFNAYLLSLLVHFPFDVNVVVEQKNTCINRLSLYTVNGVKRVCFSAFNDTHHLGNELATWK